MYTRRETQDGVTVMNKDLYDNLQDGIDELNEGLSHSQNNINVLALTLSILTKGKIPGLDSNIVIITFENEEGFTLYNGKYDSSRKVIYA